PRPGSPDATRLPRPGAAPRRGAAGETRTFRRRRSCGARRSAGRRRAARRRRRRSPSTCPRRRGPRTSRACAAPCGGEVLREPPAVVPEVEPLLDLTAAGRGECEPALRVLEQPADRVGERSVV